MTARSNWDSTHERPGDAESSRHPPELIFARYVGGRRCPSQKLGECIVAARRGEGYVWIGLHNPSEATMETLGVRLGLHELAARGCTRYVGSTDERNPAMVRIFERNGARATGTQSFYAPA